jgi:hypothetical protein
MQTKVPSGEGESNEEINFKKLKNSVELPERIKEGLNDQEIELYGKYT